MPSPPSSPSSKGAGDVRDRDLHGVRAVADVGGAGLPPLRKRGSDVPREGAGMVEERMSSIKRKSRLDHDGSMYALDVYDDGKALLGEVDKASSQVVFLRALEPHEDGSDIALAGKPRAWFESELTKGRQ